MGAFTVLATTTTGSAHASNSEVVTFLVSVNDEGGLPVTGLLNKNFLHATLPSFVLTITKYIELRNVEISRVVCNEFTFHKYRHKWWVLQ